MLADVYQNGGSILFKPAAIEAGLVQDVTSYEWYSLERDEHGDFMFIDNVGDNNYAGSVSSMVYSAMPTATLTFPL